MRLTSKLILINYKIWPQVLIAAAANGGSFLYGISLGWSATTEPEVLSAAYKFTMTEKEFSWSVSMMCLGAALSCVVSGIVRNRFGTKKTIFVFAVPNILGWLLIIFASKPIMMIIGRLFIGLAGGAYCFNIPVYVGEAASKEIRGILLTFHQSFVRLGIVFVYTLGSVFHLLTLNVVCGALAVIFTIGFSFLPETPVYLVRQNKCEMAEKSIAILRGNGYDPRLEVYELQRAFDEASKAPKSSLISEIRNRATVKAFNIIFFLFFVFQMSGINAVIFYATTIFIKSDINMDPFLATVILGIVELLATILSVFVVDKFGRVFLLITSFSMSFIGLIGIASFFSIHENHKELLTWLPLPSLCIFVIGFNLGLGTVPFVFLGEMFSHEAKKIIAPFAQTMQFAMSFVIGILYPVLVNTIGAGLTFYLFASFCALGLFFTVFFIPETKNKTLAEIQEILRK